MRQGVWRPFEYISQVSWGLYPSWVSGTHFIVRAHTAKERTCIKCLHRQVVPGALDARTSHQICMTTLQGHCCPSNRWGSSRALRLGICPRSHGNKQQSGDSHPCLAEGLVPRRPVTSLRPWGQGGLPELCSCKTVGHAGGYP